MKTQQHEQTSLLVGEKAQRLQLHGHQTRSRQSYAKTAQEVHKVSGGILPFSLLATLSAIGPDKMGNACGGGGGGGAMRISIAPA